MNVQNTKVGHIFRGKYKIAAVFIALVVLLILFNVFFPNYSPLKNSNNPVSIGDKYGVALNLPDRWVAEDCLPEPKRYIKEFKYICGWSSPSHPESGEITSVFLFASSKDIELSSSDIIVFAKERQEYGWALEIASDPNISVSFDETIDPVSYGGWGGVRTDDLVVNEETGEWYLWTSVTIPVTTPSASLILEVNHLNEEVFAEEVYYTSEDVLRNVVVLNENESR